MEDYDRCAATSSPGRVRRSEVVGQGSAQIHQNQLLPQNELRLRRRRTERGRTGPTAAQLADELARVIQRRSAA